MLKKVVYTPYPQPWHQVASGVPEENAQWRINNAIIPE
jgi:hypothetical protein